MKEIAKGGGDLGPALRENTKVNTEDDMRRSQQTAGFGTIRVSSGVAKAPLDEGPSDADQYGYTSDPNRPIHIMRKFQWRN